MTSERREAHTPLNAGSNVSRLLATFLLFIMMAVLAVASVITATISSAESERDLNSVIEFGWNSAEPGSLIQANLALVALCFVLVVILVVSISRERRSLIDAANAANSESKGLKREIGKLQDKLDSERQVREQGDTDQDKATSTQVEEAPKSEE